MAVKVRQQLFLEGWVVVPLQVDERLPPIEVYKTHESPNVAGWFGHYRKGHS